MNSKENIKLSNSLNLSIVMCLYTYPITSSFGYLLGASTSSLNIFFKSIVFLVYLVCFYRLASHKGKLLLVNIPLFLILILYSIRLLLDLSIFNISNPLYSTPYILLYFFLLTLLPVYNILKTGFYLNIPKFIKYSGVLLLIINVGYLLVTLNNGLGLADIFNSRISVVDQNNSDKSIINPIIVGLYGASLSIYSLYKILIKSKASMLCIFMFFLGLFNLAVSASRGPLLVIIILIFLLILKFFTSTKKGFNTFFGICIGYIISFFIVYPFVKQFDFFLVQRVEAFFMFEEETRNLIIESAMNDFFNNPIFGAHIFDSAYNSFPHNKIVESLMACGLIGGVFMIYSFKPFLINLYNVGFKKVNTDYGWMVVIISPFVIIGFTSGSFWSAPEFWVSLSLLSINNRKFKT